MPHTWRFVALPNEINNALLGPSQASIVIPTLDEHWVQKQHCRKTTVRRRRGGILMLISDQDENNYKMTTKIEKIIIIITENISPTGVFWCFFYYYYFVFILFIFLFFGGYTVPYTYLLD